MHAELGSSMYSLAAIPDYIDRCDTHITVTIGAAGARDPDVTINVLLVRSQYLPALLLHKVARRLYTIQRLHNITKHMTFWLLPFEQSRQFPAKGAPVSPESINGGFTYPSDAEVFVYRMEDFPKVMLHELLHHSAVDSGSTWPPEQLHSLREFFNIAPATRLLPNEAVVETWATLYQLWFIAIDSSLPFKLLYAKECEWAQLQTRRLLDHQASFCAPCAAPGGPTGGTGGTGCGARCLWKESSNSFAYIRIKTILLLNYAQFVAIPVPYNTAFLCKFIVANAGTASTNANATTVAATTATNGKANKKKTQATVAPMRISIFGDL